MRLKQSVLRGEDVKHRNKNIGIFSAMDDETKAEIAVLKARLDAKDEEIAYMRPIVERVDKAGWAMRMAYYAALGTGGLIVLIVNVRDSLIKLVK